MENTKLRELKLAAFRVIDSNAEIMTALGKDILQHPELGYKETRTSAKVLEIFNKLGVQDISRPGITGIKGYLKKSPGPCVAVMGELDAVLSPEHPFADPLCGAAHACGHNAQMSTLLGCAAGLKAVMNELKGTICLIAAPAEEFVELGWRLSLKEQGRIKYLGGKQELIHEGAFDDVDMAMMTHSETNAPYPRAVIGGPAGGFIGKEIHFLGREAHAGGAPWEGINALNAANLALSAINCCRETFKDEDKVRVHPIITRGGDVVNTVPSHVIVESFVRAAGIEAMRDANFKVNRAVKGSAAALGAEAEIKDIPGYLPLVNNPALCDIYASNAEEYFAEIKLERGLPFCGSTDMGDLSYFIPVIQPTVSGFSGAAHSKDFLVNDDNLAYVLPAKLMAAAVIDLMWNEAQKAEEIKARYPRRSREQYEELWENILR